MRRIARALVLLLSLAGCAAEPRSQGVVAYQYEDPQAEELARWRTFPGATLLPEQRDLVLAANRKISGSDENGKLLLFETDAGLDEVANFYLQPDGSREDGGPGVRVERGEGDFESEQEALAPLLEQLGARRQDRPVTGTYSTVVIRIVAGPTISLQRPYHDFLKGRIVDRTMIMISE